MQMKYYLLTSGEYSDYRVLSLIVGPASTDLSALAEEFAAKSPHAPSFEVSYQREIKWREKLPKQQIPTISEHVRNHWGGKFVSWLIDSKGFKEIEYEEVHEED